MVAVSEQGEWMTKEEVKKRVKQFLMDKLADIEPQDDFKVTVTSTPEQVQQGILNVHIEIDGNSLMGQAYLRNLEKQKNDS